MLLKSEQFLRSRVRSALLALIVLTSLPAKAAEPVRLQVIPYKAGWGSVRIPVQPVHNFPGTLQVPPPLVTEVPTIDKKPKKRRRNSRDLNWLMD